MAELNLEACPICHGQDRLFRQSMDRGGRRFIWYQCQGCGSALLWVGDDRWAYQKVGKENKEHLLGQSLSTRELQALLPRAQEASPISGTSNSLSDRHVGVGVDKSAAERAIERLTGEIADLERQKKEVGSKVMRKGLETMSGLTLLLVLSAPYVACMALALATFGGMPETSISDLPFCALVLVGLLPEGAILWYLYKAKDKAVRERAAKDAIAWRIKRKTAELERNKKLVSE